MRKTKIAFLALQHSSKGDLRLKQEIQTITKINNVDIMVLRGCKNSFKHFYRSYRDVIAFKPDIIHVHDLQSYILSFFLLKKIKDCHLILDYHEFNDLVKDHYNFRGKLTYYLYKILENHLIRISSYIITAVDDIKREKARRYRKKKVTIYNFPLKTPYKKPKKYPGLHLVYVGSVTKNSGLYESVILMNKLRLKDPTLECKLHVIGDGDIYRNKDIVDKDIIFYGRLENHKTLDIVRRCHVGICLFRKTRQRRKSLPVKIFEYLYSGLFVVATKLGGPMKLIGEKDFIFFSDNFKKHASVIYNHYTSGNLACLGDKGKNYIVKYCNWKSEEKKLLKVYHSLMPK
ncbi:MAG: glycosyltransferase [Candidatus Woesearchaeota archaeon]